MGCFFAWFNHKACQQLKRLLSWLPIDPRACLFSYPELPQPSDDWKRKQFTKREPTTIRQIEQLLEAYKVQYSNVAGSFSELP